MDIFAGSIVKSTDGRTDSHYQLQNKIGDGVTACVYSAIHVKTNKVFACKIADQRYDGEAWQRVVQILRHELAMLKLIGPHPNVVRWHDLIQSCSCVILVLELVQGGDCQQLLRRHGSFPEWRVHPMLFQLRNAVHHLHAQQVIHRDVKLENVLCDLSSWPPAVKLCDFGHSCRFAESKAELKFLGTPGYAAPEVTRGPFWSAAADVWALGVVMYALLSNTLPFQEEHSDFHAPDLSSKPWGQISVEAKLLLISLLESSLSGRATLASMGRSSWLSARQLKTAWTLPSQERFASVTSKAASLIVVAKSTSASTLSTYTTSDDISRVDVTPLQDDISFASSEPQTNSLDAGKKNAAVDEQLPEGAVARSDVASCGMATVAEKEVLWVRQAALEQITARWPREEEHGISGKLKESMQQMLLRWQLVVLSSRQAEAQTRLASSMMHS
mmetsp:Transcript_63167/g.105064  ORF Transcript_63167/g.105064 Transcript_63167/m.105064 type:complete len:444 (+) Transcript_63167:118-1449(+)